MTDSSPVSPGPILLGCAGWAIARADAAAFPEQGTHLARYGAVFGAVEINSSFYRPHRATTYARWAGSVPPAFRFSVKLPRAITHEASLVGCNEHLDRFADETSALGAKLGCVLVQLPPKLAFDAAVADAFLNRLQRVVGCTIALEARHPGWFAGEATRLLCQHGITRVIADPPKGQAGPHVPTTATIYARLHGSPRLYYSSYEPAYLAQLALDMQEHARQGRTVWTMFDNTASGAALRNALAVNDALLSNSASR
jgi:uncharacterized protein YecE (DUF72 family)